jgi:hypothetical protein
MSFPLRAGQAAGKRGKGVFAALSQGHAEQKLAEDDGALRSSRWESVCRDFRPDLARNCSGEASAAGGWRCPGGDTGWLADKWALVPRMTKSR